MQLQALVGVLSLLALPVPLTNARPTTPSSATDRHDRRWYDSNGCSLDGISSPDTDTALASTPFSTLSSLGPYSPFLSQLSPICRTAPQGYTIEQVQIYSRHGARNPTASALTKIVASLDKVVNRTSTDSSLSFLETFSYGNVTADALTDFGRREMYLSGKRYAAEYQALAGDAFFRSSSDGRVVESGEFFLQGFYNQSYSLTADKPSVNVIISEDDGQNNTLSISTCTADESLDPSYGDEAEDNWLSVFAPPIASRINSALSPSANISGSDITNLISLCSFDSLNGQDWVESPWCKVFTDDEFKGNEYFYDLSKFYDHSWGSPYGRVSAVGLINEILARLTGGPVLEGSGTNSTLDSSSSTFPVNKTFYADFSHDNNLAPLLAGLGLDWETDLPTEPSLTDIPAHKFVVSTLVPFAGRIVIERLSDSSSNKYVRIIVNDAVKRLSYEGCGDMGYTTGLCSLEAFIEAQSFARQEPSVWDQICYASPINKTLAIQA